RRVHQERQEHAAEQRLIFTRARTSMCAREDRRRRLTHQLLDRELRVGALPQGVRPMVDEGLDQRAVLVQCGLRIRGVLLERELELLAAVDVPEQGAESPETERPERGVELRSTHNHGSRYAAGGSSPFWHCGHQ